jgi:hypothetical protein
LQVIEEKGVGLFRFTGGQGMQKGKIRVGFVGFGEGNTPREIIERKCRDAEALLEAGELLEVFQTAPVSDDAAGKDVERAVKELSAANFDLLIVCLAGWIPSHAVISVADAFKHKPMVLWGLSGWKENDRFVTTCRGKDHPLRAGGQCGVKTARHAHRHDGLARYESLRHAPRRQFVAFKNRPGNRIF